METPVTYFYTDQVRTVTASVEFPSGIAHGVLSAGPIDGPAFDAKLGLGAKANRWAKGASTGVRSTSYRSRL